jgi:hypothetical protein
MQRREARADIRETYARRVHLGQARSVVRNYQYEIVAVASSRDANVAGLGALRDAVADGILDQLL